MKQVIFNFMKNNKALLCFIVFFSFNATRISAAGLAPVDSINWVAYSEEAGVKFSYRVDVCEGKNVIFLKFENTNTVAKNVDFHLIIDGPNHDLPAPQMIHLNAGQTVSGQCTATPALTKNIESSNPTILDFSMRILN